MTEKIPIGGYRQTGFPTVSGGATMSTGGMQCAWIYAHLVFHPEKMAVAGRFFFFKQNFDVYFSEIISVKPCRTFPIGHGVALKLVLNRRLRIFTVSTARQAELLRLLKEHGAG